MPPYHHALASLRYTPPSSWLGRLRDFFVDDAEERVEAAVNLSGRDKFVAVPMKASLEDVSAQARYSAPKRNTKSPITSSMQAIGSWCTTQAHTVSRDF
jgi:hypothetical protein